MAQIPVSQHRVDNAPSPTTIDPAEDDPLGLALRLMQDNVFSNETVEAIFRGDPPGVPLLGVTNTRLMLLNDQTFTERMALLSVPLKGVAGVAFAPGEGETLATTTTVGLMIGQATHLVICGSRGDARELHDMLIWTLTN